MLDLDHGTSLRTAERDSLRIAHARRTQEQEARIERLAAALGYGQIAIDRLLSMASTRDRADGLLAALKRLWVRRRRM